MDDDDSNDVMIVESNDEQPITSHNDLQKTESKYASKTLCLTWFFSMKQPVKTIITVVQRKLIHLKAI